MSEDNIVSDGNMMGAGTIVSFGNNASRSNIVSDGNNMSNGNIASEGDVVSSGSIMPNGNSTSTSNIASEDNIVSDGNIMPDGNKTSDGNMVISGGNNTTYVRSENPRDQIPVVKENKKSVVFAAILDIIHPTSETGEVLRKGLEKFLDATSESLPDTTIKAHIHAIDVGEQASFRASLEEDTGQDVEGEDVMDVDEADTGGAGADGMNIDGENEALDPAVAELEEEGEEAHKKPHSRGVIVVDDDDDDDDRYPEPEMTKAQREVARRRIVRPVHVHQSQPDRDMFLQPGNNGKYTEAALVYTRGEPAARACGPCRRLQRVTVDNHALPMQGCVFLRDGPWPLVCANCMYHYGGDVCDLYQYET